MKKGCLVLLFLALVSCGDKTPFSLPPPGNTINNGPTGPVAPGFVSLTVSGSSTPILLNFGDNANVVADVTDITGTTAVPNGTKVTFTATGGTISPQGTTAGGKATATFTAGTVPGPATVTATAGAASATLATITVNRPETGSIVFDSAVPPLIGVLGSGQQTNSLITFLVKDIKGNPVTDGTNVAFTMAGPSGGKLSTNGGEFIGANGTTTPTTAFGSTIGGEAVVILNSGAVSGSVTIRASAAVGTTTLSTTAPTISIGGGIASGPHFDLSASVLNLPGLGFNNITSNITAYIADRFGNFNILKGTSVSFYTEAGAIDRGGVTNGDGLTSVVLRTQAPAPFQVAPFVPPNPSNGHLTVLATVIGEEGFTDANGNGLYDAGEDFDDLPEPFINRNDSVFPGTRNPRFELGEFYVDSDGNGAYSLGNGVWDGPGCNQATCLPNKLIWTTINLAFTSGLAKCEIKEFVPQGQTPQGLNPIGPGQTRSVVLTIGDVNDNILIAGTTIKIGATKITYAGLKDFTLGDGVGGPVQIFFSLADPDTDINPELYTVEVEVTPGSIQGFSFSKSGCVLVGSVQ